MHAPPLSDTHGGPGHDPHAHHHRRRGCRRRRPPRPSRRGGLHPRRPRAGTRRARPGTSRPTSSPPPSSTRSPPTTSSQSSSYARDHGLRVTPAGHRPLRQHARPASTTRSSLKTARLRGVEIDPEAPRGARRGRRRSGRRSPGRRRARARRRSPAPRPTSASSATRSAAASAGSPAATASPPNSVIAVELVTADGQLVRADRDTEPDLFWAVRGGGGSFGIVTAIEFALYPVAEVYAGILFLPVRARRRDPAAPGASGSRHARRGHLRRPHHAVPAHPRGSRSRCAGSRSSSSRPPTSAERGRRRRAARSRCASSGPAMDTFATIPADGAPPPAHGSPEPVPGVGDGMNLVDLTPRDHRRPRRGRRSGSGSPLVSRRAPPARRRAVADGRPATARSARSTPASRCSPSAWR